MAFIGEARMVKVESLKKKKPSSNAVVVEKLSLKPKKLGSEIDEIFSGKKRKRVEKKEKPNITKGTKVEVAPSTKSHDKKKISGSSKSQVSEEATQTHSTSRPRKKTVDGMTVYTEEELGIGKSDAGGTRLCPFDCDCCF